MPPPAAHLRGVHARARRRRRPARADARGAAVERHVLRLHERQRRGADDGRRAASYEEAARPEARGVRGRRARACVRALAAAAAQACARRALRRAHAHLRRGAHARRGPARRRVHDWRAPTACSPTRTTRWTPSSAAARRRARPCSSTPTAATARARRAPCASASSSSSSRAPTRRGAQADEAEPPHAFTAFGLAAPRLVGAQLFNLDADPREERPQPRARPDLVARLNATFERFASVLADALHCPIQTGSGADDHIRVWREHNSTVGPWIQDQLYQYECSKLSARLYADARADVHAVPETVISRARRRRGRWRPTPQSSRRTAAGHTAARHDSSRRSRRRAPFRRRVTTSEPIAPLGTAKARHPCWSRLAGPTRARRGACCDAACDRAPYGSRAAARPRAAARAHGRARRGRGRRRAAALARVLVRGRVVAVDRAHEAVQPVLRVGLALALLLELLLPPQPPPTLEHRPPRRAGSLPPLARLPPWRAGRVAATMAATPRRASPRSERIVYAGPARGSPPPARPPPPRRRAAARDTPRSVTGASSSSS